MTMNERPGLSCSQQGDGSAWRKSCFEFRRFARESNNCLHVVEQSIGYMDTAHHRLHQQKLLRQEHGRQRGKQVTTILSHQQLAFELLVRIAKLDAHQETIELRLRQRERTDLVHRILRGNDEEWRSHGI